ncbi:MAG: flagellar motor protein MotB [Alphaproteobacteria bacterium]|jgi:chemotaxis protein MotB|nr:flagellar motor protein MotB [Thalassospira sp.]MCE2965768.1 flagellar motor protein MotB [Alphaproteobacteria bacterium]
MADERPIIIIKRIKKGGHGHHGGAWKVAYADFVTAMMAFFLLLWLLSSTTKEQREGISNYFAPTSVSSSTSGAGGILGGLSLSQINALKAPANPMLKPQEVTEGVESDEALEVEPTTGANQDGRGMTDTGKMETEAESGDAEQLKKIEEERFKRMAAQLKQAIAQDPALADMAKNLLVEMTPEGLRIQLVDSEGKPMFEAGKYQPLPYAEQVLYKVAEIIKRAPNDVEISGHTDAVPFRGYAGYSNWELSADRAHATRRTLEYAGVKGEKINRITGRADRDPLIKDDPRAAPNRRISITLLYSEVIQKQKEPDAPTAPIEGGVFR